MDTEKKIDQWFSSMNEKDRSGFINALDELLAEGARQGASEELLAVVEGEIILALSGASSVDASLARVSEGAVFYKAPETVQEKIISAVRIFMSKYRDLIPRNNPPPASVSPVEALTAIKERLTRPVESVAHQPGQLKTLPMEKTQGIVSPSKKADDPYREAV